MDTSSWDLDSSGMIILHPLMGFQTAEAAGMAPLLQIEYAADASALERGEPSRLPIVMTPLQARAIAQALLKIADFCERSPARRAQ